jgi:Na+/H+ antiporter NhaD/arsenite permease-like protein
VVEDKERESGSGSVNFMKNPKHWMGWLGLLFLLVGAPELFAEEAGGAHGDHHDTHHGVDGGNLSVFWVMPFAGMLLSIALGPLIAPHFWHGNYGKVAAGWIVLFSVPFLVTFKGDAFYEILHIVLLDYVPFIILLAALFTAAGGICLKGSLRGSPAVNTAILAIGTILASWMGTTGAAMLLIRPILRANAWRKHQVHVVVFFIFLVANIGGSLTPLGDPPLFLGFLKGVDFFWTMKLLPVMAPLAIFLLAVFFIFDSLMFKKEGKAPDDGEKVPLKLEGGINFAMVGCIIAAILLSTWLGKNKFTDPTVAEEMAPKIEAAEFEMKTAKADLVNYVTENKDAVLDDSNSEYHEKRVAHLHSVSDVNQLRATKTHDETKGLHIYGVAVPFSNLIRDVLLILIALVSLKLTPMYKMEKDDHGHEVPAEGEEESNVRAANGFTWEPILEVAKLFIAIFICMIPALKILQSGVDGSLSSVVLAVQSSTNDPVNMMYFWLTGMLSSFLDNAPTYVVFFNTAGGDPTSLMGPMAKTLLAISCGAVFMGANTYIGNAPNFMVKAIAEENGVKMPSFFGYMAWSVAILIPTFILLTLFFFWENSPVYYFWQ